MTDYLTPSSSATSSEDQLPAESDADDASVWRNQALAATAAAAETVAATSVDSPPLHPHLYTALILNPVFP